MGAKSTIIFLVGIFFTLLANSLACFLLSISSRKQHKAPPIKLAQHESGPAVQRARSSTTNVQRANINQSVSITNLKRYPAGFNPNTNPPHTLRVANYNFSNNNDNQMNEKRMRSLQQEQQQQQPMDFQSPFGGGQQDWD